LRGTFDAAKDITGTGSYQRRKTTVEYKQALCWG